jgi:hypothetical protein
MARSKTISAIFCILAFTVVFAHSVIPHEHHCHELTEKHIHHFQHCEELGTYIIKYDTSGSAAHLLFATATLPATAEIPAPEARSAEFLQDFSDPFRVRLSPRIHSGSLRGPPAILLG